MSAQIHGQRILWGADPNDATLPINNLPDDTQRVRLRFRKGSAAAAFIRTSTGVRHFLLRREGLELTLCFEQGSNRSLA